MTDVGTAGPVCPVCGRVARATRERRERVTHAGRDHGWSQKFTVYEHADGSEHRVPAGVVFDDRC